MIKVPKEATVLYNRYVTFNKLMVLIVLSLYVSHYRLYLFYHGYTVMAMFPKKVNCFMYVLCVSLWYALQNSFPYC